MSSMQYYFQFRPYQRRFRQPLKTSHGVWEVRKGIILRLESNRGVGWGEIAPLPWFGSETFEVALDFCHQLGKQINEETIKTIPNSLPACQFGFESAWQELSLAEGQKDQNLGKYLYTDPSLAYSWLLPAGEAALEAWRVGWEKEKRTFKWKIGTGAVDQEITIFRQLIEALPAGAKLRLDANGGLSLAAAKQWLEETDKTNTVEFIEQPLAPEQFDLLLDLQSNSATPIALDESVASLKDLEACYQKGWRGIFVIKAAILGFPQGLWQFCQQQEIDAVFSSVFETPIGRKAVLDLAKELSNPNRAVGFGVKQWFEQDEEEWLKQLWKY